MNIQDIKKPVIEETSEHSRYSPSGSGRWMYCHASLQMEDAIPVRVVTTKNFYAEEGTCAHELAGATLEEPDYKCDYFLGTEMNGIVIDQDMCNQVQTYVDYVRGIETYDSVLWVEARYSLQHIEETSFGTADTVCFSDTFLEVVDLKYGQGVVVEPEGNTQLMFYTSGVVKYLEDCGVFYDDDFKIKMTIHQPRAPHSDGPVRSAYITRAELRNFELEAMFAAEATKEENPKFDPEEKRCMWCRAKAKCEPLAKYNIEQAALEFGDLYDANMSFPTKHTLTDQQIIQILKHSKAIEKWVKSVVEYASDKLRHGEDVPGYKLVYGRSNRAWSNADEVEKRLLAYGTEPDRLYTRKFITAPQAEKVFTKAEWELIKSYVHKPQGAPTMAPDSDKRPAYEPNTDAAKDFEDFEDFEELE